MSQNKYSNVSDLFNDEIDDTEAVKDLKKQIHSRRLVKALSMLRVRKGKTQKEIAEEMDVTQAKISRLENGVDADLKMSEIEAYARALDTEITLLLSERNEGLAAQIKHHAFSIRKAFLELAKLAHQDERVAEGVADLQVQAFVNINRFLVEASKSMPEVTRKDMPYIRISVEEFGENGGEMEQFEQQDCAEEKNETDAIYA